MTSTLDNDSPEGTVKSGGACFNADMDSSPSYRGYRFPAEIISHCVWLYFRFCLSFRDVQEMMLERGVNVSHEAIRLWTLKFGAARCENEGFNAVSGKRQRTRVWRALGLNPLNYSL